MRENDRRVCIFCGMTLTKVAQQRKKAGRRVACRMRPTPKGFHQYRYISVLEVPNATTTIKE